ncbi:MAG TPA: class I tRNA ligase family protein [Chitinophagaceae bacterium]|nr:class I tRNA ligase family protein [Chitinophagaceae bacterium]
MEYNFSEIEQKWQQQWKETQAYKVSNDPSRPKCYVLDMFPYPSGAGLHVGHPLGYIASDIYSRYKRLKGYNVLHPMGYDSFGLPAEQYALETGQHPAVTTEKNIATFRKQLDNIGFCYDWSREVRTSDPNYYKWTQWIFLQLFNSWYNRKNDKAESIDQLEAIFAREGNIHHPCPGDANIKFFADEWSSIDEKRRQEILMEYRLAYCGYGEVNWCEALGTVLANDEVVNGVSERGGHPVIKKKLRQWYLRITEYADRLLKGLERIEFSEAMKEMQTNWIGKSSGAEIQFNIRQSSFDIIVYTTRPDTIFGVDFMVVAPEHELVAQITTPGQQKEVEEYIAYVKSRSERERMAEKKISGAFTGAYAINPFNGKQIPIWISEYVLAGYGTGAIMAVPCGDERDHKFAKHFKIPITNIIGDAYNAGEANPSKEAVLSNSDFLNGMKMKDAMEVVIAKLEEMGIGTRKENYRMRDAAFSRQRYWGEPFPVKWENGIAIALDETELPLELPHVDSYKPGPDGEGPLANISSWVEKQLETNTMPGYAGSSWYFLRYMDPHNDKAFCDRKVSDYWGQVDLYIGGTEHAVGHLLYSRMWTKALYDLGHIGFDEPFKKLVNQGMITGKSALANIIWRSYPVNIDDLHTEIVDVPYIVPLNFPKTIFGLPIKDRLPVDCITIESDGKYFITEENVKIIREKYPKFRNLTIAKPIHLKEEISSEGKPFDLDTINFTNKLELEILDEKMSKSKLNTFNPDDLVAKYGADTFRMYEMFLGPVEQSKPWDTKGIEGVHRFLKKLWRLFANVGSATPTAQELKVLHKAIKKIEDDTEHFSFNTAVSSFMICVNELTDLSCNKKEILEQLLILLTPYAPHISEELWSRLGNAGSILDAVYPKFEEKYLAESSKEYPVSVNGKVRTNITIALEAEQTEVEQIVLANEVIQKWMEGQPPKKVIFVKGRMINVVV